MLQGRQDSVVLALDIMCDAVDRYKDLCEGRYCGQQHGHLKVSEQIAKFPDNREHQMRDIQSMDTRFLALDGSLGAHNCQEHRQNVMDSKHVVAAAMALTAF